MRAFWAAIALLFLAPSAFAQAIQQVGPVTPEHAAVWVANGQAGDETLYPTWLSDELDRHFSSTPGAILCRGSAGWQAIVPGPPGQFIVSVANSCPTWTSNPGPIASTAPLPPVLNYPFQYVQPRQPIDFAAVAAMAKNPQIAWIWSPSFQQGILQGQFGRGQYGLNYAPAYALFFAAPGTGPVTTGGGTGNTAYLYKTAPQFLEYQSDQITPVEETGQSVTGTIAPAVGVSDSGATISTTTMTVNSIVSGYFVPGAVVTGTGVTGGTTIVSQLTGTAGGAGTYTVSASQSVSATTLTATNAAEGVMNVTAATGAVVRVNFFIFGSTIDPSTRIVADLTGNGNTGTYVVGVSQTVASGTIVVAQDEPLIDITNPQAVNLLISQVLINTVGASGVGLDNVSDVLTFPAAGHYSNPTDVPCAPSQQPSCGGTWTPQWTNYSQWSNANLALMQAYEAAAAALGYRVIGNVSTTSGQGGPLGISGTNRIAIVNALDGAIQESVPEHLASTTVDNFYNGFIIDDRFQQEFYNSESAPAGKLQIFFSYLNKFAFTGDASSSSTTVSSVSSTTGLAAGQPITATCGTAVGGILPGGDTIASVGVGSIVLAAQPTTTCTGANFTAVEDTANITPIEIAYNLFWILAAHQGKSTYEFVGAQGSLLPPAYPPQMGGATTVVLTGTTTSGSAVISNTSIVGSATGITGLAPGLSIAGSGVPANSYVDFATTSGGVGTVTMNNLATASATVTLVASGIPILGIGQPTSPPPTVNPLNPSGDQCGWSNGVNRGPCWRYFTFGFVVYNPVCQLAGSPLACTAAAASITIPPIPPGGNALGWYDSACNLLTPGATYMLNPATALVAFASRHSGTCPLAAS